MKVILNSSNSRSYLKYHGHYNFFLIQFLFIDMYTLPTLCSWSWFQLSLASSTSLCVFFVVLPWGFRTFKKNYCSNKSNKSNKEKYMQKIYSCFTKIRCYAHFTNLHYRQRYWLNSTPILAHIEVAQITFGENHSIPTIIPVWTP